MLKCVAGVLLVSALAGSAQVESRRVIRATGEATVPARPELAKFTAGVVTQAATAQEAANQNASLVEAMLAQLRTLLGAGADLRTVSYSLTAVYRSPSPGAAPVLTGYQASNNVEVSVADLSLVGRAIDTATQAGANNIGSLRFTVKDEQPLQTQALTQAARQARSQAEAIAAGLNVRLGGVISASEGGVSVVPTDRSLAGASSTTPVEPGLVQIRASVSAEFEILP